MKMGVELDISIIELIFIKLDTLVQNKKKSFFLPNVLFPFSASLKNKLFIDDEGTGALRNWSSIFNF